MSTIASPRDPSTPLRRLSHNPPLPGTPSSSARPSLDAPRSATASPQLQLPPGAGGGSAAKRTNRAALREYYNLKKQQQGGGSGSATPLLEVTDPLEPGLQYSEVPPGELDAANFDAEAFVGRALAESSLEELLRVYTRVLGEIRALDAEKKALVYDNYSKLIAATETIRKMRTNMDPLNPMASTLDPAIAQIYAQASSIRETLRKVVPAPDTVAAEEAEAAARRQRSRQLAREVLAAPEKVRALVAEGKVDEARREWEMPRRLLLAWRAKGVGGDDIVTCLREGDAALPGVDEDEDEDESSEGSRESKDTARS